MKRKTLYIYKKFLLLLILNSKTNNLNSLFLFNCLKNKKIIQLLILMYDNQFNPKDLLGYLSYLESLREIYNNFVLLNKQKINEGKSQELLYLLNLLILKNRKQNFKTLFDQLLKLNQLKLKFLLNDYLDFKKLKTFKLSQFPLLLNLFMQAFMLVFMDLILS